MSLTDGIQLTKLADSRVYNKSTNLLIYITISKAAIQGLSTYMHSFTEKKTTKDKL